MTITEGLPDLRQPDLDADSVAYSTGWLIGFLAATAPDDVFTDSVTDAGRVMFAAAYSREQAVARLALLGDIDRKRRDTILRASGVLSGWKTATEDRDDAEECVMDERRILTRTDSEAVLCSVGWFCNDDCHRDFDAYRCCRDEPEDHR